MSDYNEVTHAGQTYTTCLHCGAWIEDPTQDIRCELSDGFYYHFLRNDDGTETRVPRHVVAFVDVR